MRTEVIVVGAGPVGLLLAGELRLGGVDVTVLERRTGPITESRASTLHARTMELFDQRGLLDRLGTAPNERRGHFGGLPLDLGGTGGPYPGQWKVPQARTEELLREWAVSLGAEVLTGREVTDVDDDGDEVTVATRGQAGAEYLRARFVVGCDGEESTVRHLAGFDMKGTEARREILRADLNGVDIPARRFQRLPDGLAVAARLPSGVTRVMLHEFGRAPAAREGGPDFAEVRAAWARVTGENLDGAWPVWVNAFDDTCRQVTRYRRGRVLLAGDAAHRQLPVGGQALNLGLQDAANLGWKLAAEVRGWAPNGLLDSYHDERHAVGVRVLTNIAAQALLLFAGTEVESVRAVMGELLDLPVVRAHLAGAVSGLDVRYGAAEGHPAVGARLPSDAVRLDGGPRTVAAALRPGRFVLLDLAGGAGPDPDPRVRLLPASPTSRMLDGLGHVLVRPDGYVAEAGTGPRPPAASLRRWIAPAR